MPYSELSHENESRASPSRVEHRHHHLKTSCRVVAHSCSGLSFVFLCLEGRLYWKQKGHKFGWVILDGFLVYYWRD
ncbi:hypothetical protein GOBAR_DD35180 [Gossypium barbadense]|nr:hypothetical protein GOBAR_DD35180 [Gossypium barbadense]